MISGSRGMLHNHEPQTYECELDMHVKGNDHYYKWQ